MSDKTKCTLSNEDLIEAVENWAHRLCKSGGKAWTLCVPANMNHDPDILIRELCERFEALASTVSNLSTDNPSNHVHGKA